MSIQHFVKKAASDLDLNTSGPHGERMYHKYLEIISNGKIIGNVVYVDGRDKNWDKTISRGAITSTYVADNFLGKSIPACFVQGFPDHEKLIFIMADDLQKLIDKGSVSIFLNNYEYFNFENKPYELETVKGILKNFKDRHSPDETPCPQFGEGQDDRDECKECPDETWIECGLERRRLVKESRVTDIHRSVK